MSYQLVIGLEIHVRVQTASKLFCSCKNAIDLDEANTNICPICTAQPGQLPQLNKGVVEKAIRVGHAFQSHIRKISKFDRKSYFYPDNPTGYQITQLDQAILQGGEVEVFVNKEKRTFKITQMHIENDAGKLVHGKNGTQVDYNRSGAPLFEIVTEPDFRSAEEATSFMKEVQKIMRYIGVSDADMDKGMMRADVNVSINKPTDTEFGTRVEIKNMNSFSEIEKAIAYEKARQIELIESNTPFTQETRGWDMKQGISISQRSKEGAADYRYFPEPDIPLVHLSDEMIAAQSELPELPAARLERFMNEYKLSFEDALLLTESKDSADFFEESAQASGEPQKTFNWMASELLKYIQESNISFAESKMTPEHLAELICLIKDGLISGKIAKDIFSELFKTGQNPTVYVDQHNLKQNSNIEELEAICAKVLSDSAPLVEEYKNGKDRLFGAFVGKVMKETKGQANPALVNEILKKLLS